MLVIQDPGKYTKLILNRGEKKKQEKQNKICH